MADRIELCFENKADRNTGPGIYVKLNNEKAV
jgi:hypothetical protein